ncbi:DUF1638 domain-containing protein [Candidatus Formimonas warabiya]|uniref:DUF1638 domain-containing protein n=1 Tax=Formimonas warabiya TaxID=1761012 RepID=UPI001BE3D717|nr:DUF1638 domain-containing protein [Candidatus Formimonas warabiya]
MNQTKIFACRTLEEEIREVLPANVDYEFLEYGLHNTPDKLRQELQKRIEEAEQYETLLFGYGLCSNGVAGLRSEKHTMVIPRVHDCISLLLGSRKRYDAEFEMYPGTYYLSKGWIKQKAEPLSGFHRYCEKYGEESARWIIAEEYKNYQRVAFIHTGTNNDEYVKYGREVAKFLNVEFFEIEGSLYFFEQLVNGNWNKEFLIVPPGKNILINNFM